MRPWSTEFQHGMTDITLWMVYIQQGMKLCQHVIKFEEEMLFGLGLPSVINFLHDLVEWIKISEWES